MRERRESEADYSSYSEPHIDKNNEFSGFTLKISCSDFHSGLFRPPTHAFGHKSTFLFKNQSVKMLSKLNFLSEIIIFSMFILGSFIWF